MAGHSKWANIKHRKERSDQKKGKIFSRLVKEIMSAVRQGGSDPKNNSKLKAAIEKARSANLPNENIERNIKKASSGESSDYTEITYELYGYGGVGILADVMTDNKNRIASEIRIATNKCGGTIATPGAVAYNFDRRGVIEIETKEIAEDDLLLLVSESGGEDLFLEGEIFQVITSASAFDKVVKALEEKGIALLDKEIRMVPKTFVECGEEDAGHNLALIEWLEKIDDVDAVYHNMR